MITIKKLCDCPEYLEQSACWFSQKWSVPMEVYRQSMRQYINQGQGIPQWYIGLDEQENIIAGAGLIDNDFHERKDLTPNLCALFVEEEFRKQGIAKEFLDFARKQTGEMGYKQLYLITTHTTFYEKCGWDFLAMVREEEGNMIRMYCAAAL